jgi:PAS domain S-box-containing protein
VDGGTVVAQFSYDVQASRWAWSPALYELHGLAAGEQPVTGHLLDRMVEEDAVGAEERMRHHLTHPGPYTSLYRMVDARGSQRRLRVVGNAVVEGEEVARLEGFVLDVTEDVRALQASAVDAAMEHRAAIEQAKGALMLALHIDEDEAFDVLRSFSNNQNEKLWAVAERLTDSFRDSRYVDLDPVRLLEVLLPGEPQAAARRP